MLKPIRLHPLISPSLTWWLRSMIAAPCLILAAPVSAADAETHHRNWPHWRGPSANGLVTHGNPPTEWSEQKNVKWKVAIPGKGHATPIVWDNKIFVLTAVPSGAPAQALLRPSAPSIPAGQVRPPQEPEGGERRRRGGFGGRGGGERPNQEFAFTVLCLDRATGRTGWEKVARKAIPHQGIQPSNSYSSGSPVTDGTHLFVSFGSEGLYAYDLNGNLVWERDLGKVSVTFGEGSSPALHGSTLVVLQDNNGESFVHALDKKTGRELWKKQRDEGSGWTTPSFIEHNGKVQVVINGSNAVRSYDLETGDVLWQCSGLGSNPVPMLVSDATTVYAMSGHRNPAALAIALGRTGNLTDTDAVRWRTDRGTPYVPSPLLYDGLLFFCQRTEARVTCLDAASGQAHYEQEKLDGITGVYASPIGVQNRIYLAGQNGTTLVLAKGKEIKVLASNSLEDGFDASPAVAGDELFLRGRGHLYCIASR